ncbi:MAG: Gfo/Idh/MocA family oxidoreductase [Clostridia bacterium]|nr:Gfo/Idh/MocA family oxidoreductase [Clostridia bacterium]
MKEIRVALLGYGGIARAHMHGYDVLEKEGFPIHRVALCDVDPEQFSAVQKINIEADGKQTTGSLHLYTDVDEMLANEEIDLVDICLPTYLHKDYAIRMLRAGKHVQCEKPMALSYADCAEMIATAKECGRHLMIGQCLRFNANYLALKALIDEGRYGRVISASFERLSALPRWGFEGWFRDVKRSGGALMDMGVHDVDMVRYLLGEPDAVSAISVDMDMPKQSYTCRLLYKNGPFVTTQVSWCEAPGFPFSCPFHVTLEKATVTWDGRGQVTVYPAGGEVYTLAYEQCDHMAEEIRYLGEVILGMHENKKNPPESAMATMKIVALLDASAAQGGQTLFTEKEL